MAVCMKRLLPGLMMAASMAVGAARADDATQPSAPPSTQAVEATKVSIHIDANNVRDATQQIGQALGISVGQMGMLRTGRRSAPMNSEAAPQQKDRTIKFDADQQPFAATLANLLQSTGLSPLSGNGLSALRDVAPLRAVVLSDQTSLIVLQTSVSAQRYFQTQQPPNYSYGLQFCLFTDPKMKIVAASQQAAIDSIEYDGTPLRKENNFFSPSLQQINLSPIPVWSGQLNFSSNKPATSIKRLVGHVRCYELAQEAKVELSMDDITSNQTVQGDGIGAVASLDDNQGNVLQINLVGPATESYSGSNFFNMTGNVAQVVGADDKPLPVNSNIQVDQRSHSLTVRLFFQGPDPAGTIQKIEKIRIHLPTKVRPIDVPFEVTDLPLP